MLCFTVCRATCFLPGCCPRSESHLCLSLLSWIFSFQHIQKTQHVTIANWHLRSCFKFKTYSIYLGSTSIRFMIMWDHSLYINMMPSIIYIIRDGQCLIYRLNQIVSSYSTLAMWKLTTSVYVIEKQWGLSSFYSVVCKSTMFTIIFYIYYPIYFIIYYHLYLVDGRRIVNNWKTT